jgi:ATP-dependent 26S proteasome regulatory subunit
LQRLDRLLARAVTAAENAYGQSTAADPFRGLYIKLGDVERLLAREPGMPALWVEAEDANEGASTEAAELSRLTWLKSTFGLSRFDIDVLLVALAPDLDLRYERLYAYLQDDVTRKRPGVDLVLNLLTSSATEKLRRRAHFAPEAPLIMHRLLHLIPEPQHSHPPLLAHYLKVDEQIVRLLLEQDSLDARLAPFCQLREPSVSFDELLVTVEVKRALPALAMHARELRRPLRLYFHGAPGAGKHRAAEALAATIGMRLLTVDIMRALASTTDFAQFLPFLLREAWFQDAILYLDGLDALRSDERSVQYQHLLDALCEDAGITILAGSQPWVPSGRGSMGVMTIAFPMPDFTERRACWQTHLSAENISLARQDLDALTACFHLLPGQIANAVVTACHQARWHWAAQSSGESRSQANAPPTLHDLFTAARAQSGHDLAALAQKIEPHYTWDDIVLPDDTLAQLREICQRVVYRHQVLGEWGFDRKLSLGKGVTALFAGPSGTGKTMAAEIIANALGLELYRIDLSGVVSKYIGETEKNLERIFRAAENANAILFFDEADALFGKRSEVRDSHDRYANIEISYLLQKMEQFEGVAILATNLRGNLDEAFLRRLAFTIPFPFPDSADRRRIWASIWPAATPVARDVNLDVLAQQFKLSGGNIKNIALAAAFLAAQDGDIVTMTHLLQATRREYQKLGKPLSDAELGALTLEAGV